MGRLEGKVALITGAARGQGEHAARLFVAEGASVLLTDVLDDRGSGLAEELGENASYLHLDVSQEDEWTKAASAVEERFGRFDVLVNNAGIIFGSSFESLSLETFERIIAVNQIGCFLGMKAAIEGMKAAGGGSIINISSIAGLRGSPGLMGYVATKFAITGMTKTAALELAKYSIRVNSVHPGGVNTEMTRGEGVDHVDTDAMTKDWPIPRLGRPEEIAPIVVFLASDESSYCTGSEFVIDGGVTAGT